MDDKRLVEELVTTFLLNTCRLHPRLTLPAVQAAVAVSCAQVAGKLQPSDDHEVALIPLITGSVAEFYIEPMIPHVGDVDLMFYCNYWLAIPAGQTPPSQLPADFHDNMDVFDIVDSHLPGYVYLELHYLLTECADDGKYTAVECDTQEYLVNLAISDKIATHGSALLAVFVNSGQLPQDFVHCVRCLAWPPQAADWPTRHRNYDWPDSATVDRVVSNGCDLVGVAHRQCRQHEWMGKYQWRFSFSRAEIVLLNSWMPVQQIVYHMLRVFMKAERLTDSNDVPASGKLSNYHIKTLMLWASELEPRSWWTDDLNLVRICVKLLHSLAVWLSEARCPHYFIINCNLINNTPNMAEIISSRLMSINKSWLSLWFVNNYIRRCSQLCPGNVSRLFDDNITITKLQTAVSAIIEYRQNIALGDMWRVFLEAHRAITGVVSTVSLTVRSLDWWLNHLPGINTSLLVYFHSFTYLHIACRASRSCLTDELMDVLAKLVGLQFTGPQRSNPRTNAFCLSKAVKLMKLSSCIELSKAYLYRAVSCEDTDSDSIYCLAHVYLAALYYSTGQYQTSIDHCTVVTGHKITHSVVHVSWKVKFYRK